MGHKQLVLNNLIIYDKLLSGPPVKEQMFYQMTGENERKIHHNRKGRERLDYTNTMENWENAEVNIFDNNYNVYI